MAVTRPPIAPLAGTALADLARSKPALVAENALLRHQVAILLRAAQCAPTGRALLVLLASRVRTWRSALPIVQPATLLRWHRQLFRRRQCRPLAPETITLIRELAGANRLWGAERIRREFLKLDICVA